MDRTKRYYQKNPSFVYRKIAGELILVPIRQNVGDLESIYTLDPVAGFIWEQIDGKKDLQDIKKSVLKEFNVEAVVAERDLNELLQQLNELGAVKIRENA